MVGCSGSGKSTTAAAIAERIGAPFIELDSIFHQPNWEPLPDSDFRARVEAATLGDRWVVDGNYSVVRTSIVWPRADTVVWLDLPKATVMRQVTVRSIRRAVLREELWNGNREKLSNVLARDPEKSMIRWTWKHHGRKRIQMGEAMTDPRWSHATWVRLGSVRDIDAFLETLDN